MCAVAPPDRMTVDVTDAASFAAATNASPQAIADLERYRSYLAEWNEKMNLIGPATLDTFWSRHAWDSAQILPLAPDALTWADLGTGAGLPGIVLAIMIIPTVSAVTREVFLQVPRETIDGAWALGATKWQTIYKVVLPAAKLGIVDAIVLGMGRAIGETMAVLMVVGNAPVIPDSIASPISTLTSQIALDMSYSSGLHRSALFGMGVVLFIISATLVGIVRLISKKKRG